MYNVTERSLTVLRSLSIFLMLGTYIYIYTPYIYIYSIYIYIYIYTMKSVSRQNIFVVAVISKLVYFMRAVTGK